MIPLYTQINKIIDIFQGTFQDGKYKIPINHMKALYGNPISDSKGILDIVNKIIDYVHNNIIKLDIYDKDIIPRECSTSHSDKVAGIASESREIINNVRGKGLMIAFDLPDQEKRDSMLDSMFDNGLLAMKSGDHSIRFRGMLDTPEEAINQALKIVAQSIPSA